MLTLVLLVGGAGLALAAGAAIWWNWGRPKRVPDRIEAIGCVEFVTHTYAHRTGWNTGRLGWGRHENYSLRHQGKPILIPEYPEANRFNAVFRLPSTEPAVVVNVGDPNNVSRYYLVRCAGSEPVLTLMGDSSSGNVSAAPIDGNPGGASASPFSGAKTLSGSRLFLFGGRLVLDVQTLRAYPLTVSVEGFSPNSFMPPLAASPDQRSIVLFGYGESPENAPTLAILDFTNGARELIELDRGTMRFNRWEDIDRAWFEHHFTWKSERGHPDRLVVRAGFHPLPYKGQRSIQPGYFEYRIMHVAPPMLDVVLNLLRDEYQAALADPDTRYGYRFEVAGESIHVSSRHVSSRHAGEDSYVTLYSDRAADPSQFQARHLQAIAGRLDQVLATGKHDALFHQRP